MTLLDVSQGTVESDHHCAAACGCRTVNPGLREVHARSEGVSAQGQSCPALVFNFSMKLSFCRGKQSNPTCCPVNSENSCIRAREGWVCSPAVLVPGMGSALPILQMRTTEQRSAAEPELLPHPPQWSSSWPGLHESEGSPQGRARSSRARAQVHRCFPSQSRRPSSAPCRAND